MSSHHIVRDEQEPALLALNASFLYHSKVAALLEWSPFIAAPAGQVETLLSMDIRPDVILQPKGEMVSYPWVSALSLPVVGCTDVWPESLHFLLTRGHKMVNILAAPDGRLHIPELLAESMDIVFYTPESRFLWIRRGLYRKWLPAGVLIKLHCAPGDLASFYLSGLEVVGRTLHADLLTPSDGMVEIAGNKPFLLEELL